MRREHWDVTETAENVIKGTSECAKVPPPPHRTESENDTKDRKRALTQFLFSEGIGKNITPRFRREEAERRGKKIIGEGRRERETEEESEFSLSRREKEGELERLFPFCCAVGTSAVGFSLGFVLYCYYHRNKCSKKDDFCGDFSFVSTAARSGFPFWQGENNRTSPYSEQTSQWSLLGGVDTQNNHNNQWVTRLVGSIFCSGSLKTKSDFLRLWLENKKRQLGLSVGNNSVGGKNSVTGNSASEYIDNSTTAENSDSLPVQSVFTELKKKMTASAAGSFEAGSSAGKVTSGKTTSGKGNSSGLSSGDIPANAEALASNAMGDASGGHANFRPSIFSFSGVTSSGASQIYTSTKGRKLNADDLIADASAERGWVMGSVDAVKFFFQEWTEKCFPNGVIPPKVWEWWSVLYQAISRHCRKAVDFLSVCVLERVSSLKPYFARYYNRVYDSVDSVVSRVLKIWPLSSIAVYVKHYSVRFNAWFQQSVLKQILGLDLKGIKTSILQIPTSVNQYMISNPDMTHLIGCSFLGFSGFFFYLARRKMRDIEALRVIPFTPIADIPVLLQSVSLDSHHAGSMVL